MLSDCRPRRACCLLLTMLVSALVGAVAGHLLITHFLFVRLGFWFGLVFGTILLFTLLRNGLSGYNPPRNGLSWLYPGALLVALFLLIASSLIGVMICDAHCVSHGLVFAVTSGSLFYVLLNILRFIRLSLRPRVPNLTTEEIPG